MISQLFCSETYPKQTSVHRLRGAMVARLTPDQKVACSSPVGVSWCVFRALNWFLSNCTKTLCKKNAASATALNLLLNAISFKIGTQLCECKSFQYQ